MATRVERWQQISIPLLMMVLAFAPLFRASNRPLPLLALELSAMLLLALSLWNPARLRRLPGPLLVLGLALLLIPLLHLMPVPSALWDALPGRQPYVETLMLVAGEQKAQWSAISVIAGHTEAALYQTLPVIAVFTAVYLLPVEQVRKLVLVLLAVAGFQALLGLMQYGAGPQSPLHFGNPYASNSAAGTYPNRDHLAGLLEMVFPISLALFVASLGHGSRQKSRRRSRWRRKLEFMTSVKGHNAAIYGALTVLLLLGLIFTRSRTGAGLAMLGLFIAMLAFARRLGGSNVYGTLGTVAAIVVVLAAEVGLAPVLDRFALDPLADARWTIFSTSLEGIGGFFPIGSGAGTYTALYPLFQPVEFGSKVVNHAHNDFIEALFEGGVPALLVMTLGVSLYFRQWTRVWVAGHWGMFRFIQVGAGIGLFLMLLHSLVDFNMQIPANALFTAFLLAVFFKEYKEEPKKRRRRKPTPTLDDTVARQAPQMTVSDDSPQLTEVGVVVPDETEVTPSKTQQGADIDEEENPFLKPT